MAKTDDLIPPASTVDQADLGVGPRELVVLISSLMALMALGIDLMLPGFDDIREAFDLGEGSNQVGQVITFYFFGLAVAQLLFGPLADRYGRKPVLYFGIGVYIAGAAASALAPSFGFLLAARVLWGIGAAAARVVATAIIRDRFVGDQMARAMSQVMAVFVLVPVFAPLIGAGIIAVLPWQAMFWACAVWALVIAAWSTRLSETLNPANQLPLSAGNIGRAFREVLSIRLAAGYTLASVFMQAVFTMYLASSELMISEIFGRGNQFPIIFGVVAIGFGIAAVVNSRMVERYGIDGMVGFALKAQFVLAPLLVAVAVLGNGRPSFWLFMPFLTLILSLFMLLMPNLNTAAMIPVGHIAGSASALMSAVRVGVGSVIAAVLTQYISDSVTPFAVATCALVFLTAVAVRVSGTAASVQSTVEPGMA